MRERGRERRERERERERERARERDRVSNEKHLKEPDSTHGYADESVVIFRAKFPRQKREPLTKPLAFTPSNCHISVSACASVIHHAGVVLWLRARLHHAMPGHPCVPKQTIGAGAYRPEAGRRGREPRRGRPGSSGLRRTPCSVPSVR